MSCFRKYHLMKTSPSTTKENSMKPSILDKELAAAFCKEHKIAPFRLKQIYVAIFKQHIIEFADMTTLSLADRELFAEHFCIVPLSLNEAIHDEETTKFLFETSDGQIVETVMMYHIHHAESDTVLNRLTLCISSQVWCNVWCIFCVTWKMWLLKNLHWTEILGQVLYANNFATKKFWKKEDGTRHAVRNIVFMGMGEPMLNYNAVKITCEFLTDTVYLWLSRKRVTISTSWVIPPMQQFIKDWLPVSLAFSLHSPDQELREKLVPTIAKHYTIPKLMDVLNEYIRVTGNKVFFEYVMLRDTNDSEEIAHMCGKLLKWMHAHLNLIPYNKNPAIDMKESSMSTIKRFQHIVMTYWLPVTIRKNMWRKANSACGQLWYQKVMENMGKEK